MNEPGTCTLWQKHVADPEFSHPQLYLPDEVDAQKVIIMKIVTEHLAVNICFRREDFARMLAKPNDGDPTEVAIDIEEDE